MIYLFTGQPGSGKTTLAKKLQMWLQTDKKNWRKSVFHIDGDQLRELFPNTDYSREGRERNIQKAFDIAKYLDSNGTDVVISLVSPYKELREKFKAECKVQEIYCHTKKIRGRENFFALDYEPPTEFYVDLDTSDSTDNTFNKLLKIIDQMFLYEMPPNIQSNQHTIRIHPKLTDKLLQELSKSARELIIKLYLTCEMNYANGIKIYEAIVESSIVSTGQKRINNLEQTAKKIYVPSELPK